MDARGLRSWAFGLVLIYLVVGAFAAVIYRTALGGLTLIVAALLMLALALGVAWASAVRRGRANSPNRPPSRK